MDFNRIGYHFARANVIPQIVLDIGANKCQWTRQFKSFYRDCNVYMFEANKNIEVDLSGLTNVVYQFTLLGSEDKDNVPFYQVISGDDTGNSIYLENSIYFRQHEVNLLKMNKLDTLMGELYDKIDLIKIDVQGAELDVLKGGINTVNKCDLIILEISFQQYNKGAPLACEVFNYMDNIGFQAIDILEKHYFGFDFIQADFLFARKNSSYIQDKFGY